MKTHFLFALVIVFCFTCLQLVAEDIAEIGNPSLVAEAAANRAEEPSSNELFRLFKDPPAGMVVEGWLSFGNGALSDHDPTTLRLSPGTTGLNQLGFSIDGIADQVGALHLDFLYGRDVGLFRSFGNNSNGWDNSGGFVHNDHAWAVPQAYVEMFVGDIGGIQFGHFLMNSEATRAVGVDMEELGFWDLTRGGRSAGHFSRNRFFATRTLSERTIEPYTLTGVLFQMILGEFGTSVGWTAGTNTGFDSMNNASSSTFVFSIDRDYENLTIFYDALIGDIGDGNTGGTIEDSYYHVISASYKANEKLSLGIAHIFQNNPLLDDHTSVVRQTAYYTLSDTIKLGQRYENSRQSVIVDETVSVGLNYRRASWSNLLLRPEIRWGRNVLGQQTEFFMDAVITF